MDADVDPDRSSGRNVDPHMVDLSNEAKAICPYTIRYLDVTDLELEEDLLVPKLMLFRNEWNSTIDIFNKRTNGRRGSAVFTGQPGIGEHYYWYLIISSNQHTREDMHVVFHPYSLYHSPPANCVSGYRWQCLHY